MKYSAQMAAALWTTPPQFDNTQKHATTEFVKRAQGNLAGVTNIVANRSLTAADIGLLIWFSSAGTYALTLPTPTVLGVPFGASVSLFTTTTAGSLVTTGGAQIQDQSGAIVSSFAINPGQSLRLVAIGVNQWLIVDSTAQLGKNSDFATMLAATDYQKLPGGRIIQFGTVAGNASAPVPFSFPIAFPVALDSLVLSVAITPGSNGVFGSLESQSRTGASYQAWSSSTTRVALNCYYVAIGR